MCSLNLIPFEQCHPREGCKLEKRAYQQLPSGRFRNGGRPEVIVYWMIVPLLLPSSSQPAVWSLSLEMGTDIKATGEALLIVIATAGINGNGESLLNKLLLLVQCFIIVHWLIVSTFIAISRTDTRTVHTVLNPVISKTAVLLLLALQ